MKKLGLVVVAFLSVGCLSNSPTPQAEVEKNAKENIMKANDTLYNEIYGKVLKIEDSQKLNECVAGILVSKLTQDEKLFLGGSTAEKAQVSESAKSVLDKVKPTSSESKEAIKTCSVTLGVAKAISKVK